MARKDDRLSELEQIVLGIVWKQGPCTPHAIRKNFLASSSSRWSGSAGAIYPLVERMESRQLIRSTLDESTRQKRRLYRITRKGQRRLRAWLGPPFGEEVFDVPDDPLRLRMYFLQALPESERAGFFRAAEEGVRGQIAKLRAEKATYSEKGWLASAVAMDGAIEVCRAQLRWIRRAGEVLGEEIPVEP